MKKYLIYKFTSPSGKSYIGQTCDLKRRKILHKNTNTCRAFHNAIKKYGFENFIEEILKENLTLEDANTFEEIYIEQYNTLAPNGYNLLSGGLNKIPSEETLNKMSKNSNNKGENNPMFGKTHTEESKQKNRESQLGELSFMWGKIGKNHPSYGSKRTEYERELQSKRQMGENNPNYGNVGKSNPLSKKYIITFPDGHEEIIIGVKNFCRKNELSSTCMSLIAKGKRKHHKGFKCRYYTEPLIEPPTD
ncbi:MAG: NUMOD3 domain-containing DNA-binding protein [Bacilli bacterium]|nr:NUMOD3 domain-containing DNA-binding protein [Bacilli bacterium]